MPTQTKSVRVVAIQEAWSDKMARRISTVWHPPPKIAPGDTFATGREFAEKAQISIVEVYHAFQAEKRRVECVAQSGVPFIPNPLRLTVVVDGLLLEWERKTDREYEREMEHYWRRFQSWRRRKKRTRDQAAAARTASRLAVDPVNRFVATAPGPTVEVTE
jgi:hypothetical protein